MEKVALRIAYDGSAFYGFQRQPDVRTVEGEILKALKRLDIISDPEVSQFKGASRTDRGVSAFFNVVSFVPNPKRLHLLKPEILNHNMKDVWVLSAVEVPSEFHPRFWAKSKTYRYYLVDEGFDVERLVECASLFEGIHDFSAFAKLEPGRDPVREVTRITVEKRPGYYVVEIEGKSFLWEMVRRIVNALRFCGLGLMDPWEVKKMLEGNYTRKVPPARPEPLVLWHIEYDVKFIVDEEALKSARQDIFERYSAALTRAALFGDFLLEL